MSEPNVSVPTETAVNPAATATAEPVDEPPGFYKVVNSELQLLTMGTLRYDRHWNHPCGSRLERMEIASVLRQQTIPNSLDEIFK